VKYIIFLVDADQLFDTALGMYDFSLVLMIAQHAQKVAIPSHHIRSRSLLISCVPGSTRVSPIPERTPGARQILSEIPHRRPSEEISECFAESEPRWYAYGFVRSSLTHL
jgi:hypothetical protein